MYLVIKNLSQFDDIYVLIAGIIAKLIFIVVIKFVFFQLAVKVCFSSPAAVVRSIITLY